VEGLGGPLEEGGGAMVAASISARRRLRFISASWRDARSAFMERLA
jgi:hypothetical protein